MPGSRLAAAQPVIALRADKDTASEQVTQAILGAALTVLERKAGWTYVEMEDTYRGWVREDGLQTVPCPPDYPRLPAVRVARLFAEVALNGQNLLILSNESVLEVQSEASDTYLTVRLPEGTVGRIERAAVADLREPRAPATRESLPRTAWQFLGVPYLWGGTSAFGLDCSGFVQLVYKIHGLPILRDADQQATQGAPVEWDELRPGDLIFFAGGSDPHNRQISHVGMAYGSAEFIHAAGEGRGVILTPLDDPRYREIYWGARRFLP
ncbi:MAG: C40 family peptidase [Armatimonadetes bacterium]|nr:C40 family peptidase [Armatimonadota bacterium]